MLVVLSCCMCGIEIIIYWGFGSVHYVLCTSAFVDGRIFNRVYSTYPVSQENCAAFVGSRDENEALING